MIEQVRKLIEAERDAWQAQHTADSAAESLGGFSALEQLLSKLDSCDAMADRQECEECGGAGGFEYQAMHGCSRDVCSECGGTGEVPSATAEELDEGVTLPAQQFKPLEWEIDKHGCHSAQTQFGEYMVEDNLSSLRILGHRYWLSWRFGDDDSVPCDSIEHGKQLAEQDWQRR